MSASKYELTVEQGVHRIPRDEWNALVRESDIPFLEWDWIAAMELSGSASPDTGWLPLHFCLWDSGTDGKKHLTAAAPFYLKTNSDGEYVYDYFWAEAAASYGKNWYPKLVGTIPATPAEGYRFLHADGADPQYVTELILAAAENVCVKNGVKSINLLFAEPEWAENLPALGYRAWEHAHFLWENDNFKTFDDYLARFTKGQRKNIRKEYASHIEQNIDINIIEGKNAEKIHFEKMFELFSLTNDKFFPWDARWVNGEFFALVEKNFRDRAAFVEARPRAGSTDDILAMAFLVYKNDRMWGRYWGAYRDIRDLHFAACYYAPIDWCIKNGVRSFDPGAGSPHKIRRGFKMGSDHSWHKFFDPFLARLFRDNIGMVNAQERENIDMMNRELPFKKENT